MAYDLTANWKRDVARGDNLYDYHYKQIFEHPRNTKRGGWAALANISTPIRHGYLARPYRQRSDELRNQAYTRSQGEFDRISQLDPDSTEYMNELKKGIVDPLNTDEMTAYFTNELTAANARAAARATRAHENQDREDTQQHDKDLKQIEHDLGIKDKKADAYWDQWKARQNYARALERLGIENAHEMTFEQLEQFLTNKYGKDRDENKARLDAIQSEIDTLEELRIKGRGFLNDKALKFLDERIANRAAERDELIDDRASARDAQEAEDLATHEGGITRQNQDNQAGHVANQIDQRAEQTRMTDRARLGLEHFLENKTGTPEEPAFRYQTITGDDQQAVDNFKALTGRPISDDARYYRNKDGSINYNRPRVLELDRERGTWEHKELKDLTFDKDAKTPQEKLDDRVELIDNAARMQVMSEEIWDLWEELKATYNITGPDTLVGKYLQSTWRFDGGIGSAFANALQEYSLTARQLIRYSEAAEDKTLKGAQSNIEGLMQGVLLFYAGNTPEGDWSEFSKESFENTMNRGDARNQTILDDLLFKGEGDEKKLLGTIDIPDDVKDDPGLLIEWSDMMIAENSSRGYGLPDMYFPVLINSINRKNDLSGDGWQRRSIP